MIVRAARRLLAGLAVAFAALALIAVMTAGRGDRRLYPPAAGAPRVDVVVINHGYHAGLVLPRAVLAEIAARDELAALRAVAMRFAAFNAMEVGWGDEGFYREAPTLSAVTVRLALRALFRPGNVSVLHVVGLNDDPARVFRTSEVVMLHLSADGFARLLRLLDASFARPDGGGAVSELGPGLYGPSLFYRAVGAFHAFNLCNHWVARLLDAAGVPTSPVLATLPSGLLLDLRWRAGLAAGSAPPS